MPRGATVAVTDIHTDPRLDDPTLGGREDHFRSGFAAILATPISLGGGALVGVLLLLNADDNAPAIPGPATTFASIEGVARELRVTLETARLLEAAPASRIGCWRCIGPRPSLRRTPTPTP